MSLELHEAESLAAELIESFRPYCDRLAVAGSVRRRKPVVKDIEIVVVPRVEERVARQQQQSMFALLGGLVEAEYDSVNLLDEALKAGDWQYQFEARSFGPAAKTLMVEMGAKTVQLDLFSVVPGMKAQWGVIFMIRTGSGIGPRGDAQSGFGPAMLSRWKKVGGSRCEHGTLHHMNNTHVSTPEEQDVFDACRVSYVPPELRTDAGVVQAHAIR